MPIISKGFMKKFLIANWKENKNNAEINAFFDAFSASYKQNENVEVVICPSFLYCALTSWLIQKNNLQGVYCGGQDVSLYKGGSHTGSVSAVQLKDFCKYCIVGHSETGDTLGVVKQKAQICVENGITPFVCLKDAEAFKEELPVGSIRVWEDPTNISKEGVYHDLTPEDLEKRITQIREVTGPDEPIVYGGSVHPENVDVLMSSSANFAGYLVGHASLNPQTFVSLLNKISI